MIKKFWEYARYGVLLLLVFLITISSHPTIMDLSDSGGVTKGTILSSYIIYVFVVLLLMCFTNKSFLKCKTLLFSGAIFFFIILYYFITCSFYGTENMMEDARAILISLFAVLIGWQLDLDRKGLYLLLMVYAGLVLYVGVMQVIVNVGGFEILDEYESDNKNALGVMLSTSAIIFLFIGLNWNRIGWARAVFFAVAVASIVVMLTIRARAATISCGLMVLYVFVERFKKKHFLIYFFIGVVLAVGIYKAIPASAKDFIYDSFYQNYESQDFTSDRLARNIAAIRFLSQHFWLGNLNAYTTLAWIHNYPLEKLYKYGFIFSFPILFLYLFLLVTTIIKSAKTDNRNILNIGYYLLLIPYIISMVEPTFPFGPGTASVFNFIIFGVTLRSTLSESKANLTNNTEHTMAFFRNLFKYR